MKNFIFCLLLVSTNLFAKTVTYSLNGQKLKFETITEEQFVQAQQIIAGIDYLDYSDLNNCEARAFWQIWELGAAEIATGLISINGNLANEWNYHVASVVMVEGHEQPVVFDRSLAPNGPVPIKSWIKLVSVDDDWSAWAGSREVKEDMMVLNHYCSVFENPRGNKQISNYVDENLSSHAQSLFKKLDELGKIEGLEENFDCTDQGLEWM